MKVLVTGGCGFIGSNTAARHVGLGHSVTVLDNLSRRGTDKNLQWLQGLGKVRFLKTDVRDRRGVLRALKAGPYGVVYHFAGQVAVTTSVTDPRTDFEVNALGTLNVLEAMRLTRSKAVLIYASTNKVYGEMEHVPLREGKTNVRYRTYPNGIPESFPLDFHSPYGCSKGAADQYIRDYRRIYGLNTVVFRQSCIYGERQFGIEDQGWVAHFIIQTALGRDIRIYGDGRQVRDVLYVGDLISAYECAWKKRALSRGRIYNMGGGASNQISLLDFVYILEKEFGRKIRPTFHPARPGDQRIFVSDNSKIERELGWKQKMDHRSGIARLISWVEDNRGLFG